MKPKRSRLVEDMYMSTVPIIGEGKNVDSYVDLGDF